MTKPIEEADGARDRQRGDERPAVVGDQDHGRVGADAEEERVPDRDLARVARDDVQAEDGHGQRDALRPADGQEVLPDVDDVEEPGEQQDPAEGLERAVGRRAALDDDREPLHTRSTRLDPNRPCGRK